MLRLSITSILLSFFAILASSVDLLSDTVIRGKIGDKVAVLLSSLSNQQSNSVTGIFTAKMTISNPTVIFPLSVDFQKNDSLTENIPEIIAQKVQRISQNTYQIECLYQIPKGQFSMVLAAELLAGNDSTSDIIVSSIQANHSIDTTTKQIIVISESIGTPLPYVRFAKLEHPIPNPVSRSTQISWSYQIDIPSSVFFTVYDITGREVLKDIIQHNTFGIFTYTIDARTILSSGMYWLQMETKTGIDFQGFEVMP